MILRSFHHEDTKTQSPKINRKTLKVETTLLSPLGAMVVNRSSDWSSEFSELQLSKFRPSVFALIRAIRAIRG
jgi:hypothetical protein